MFSIQESPANFILSCRLQLLCLMGNFSTQLDGSVIEFAGREFLSASSEYQHVHVKSKLNWKDSP